MQIDAKAIVQPPKLISRRTGWAWVACQFLLLAALVLSPASPALHAPQKIDWIIFASGLIIFVAAYAALGKSFTPNPVPRAEATFIAHGIYQWIRHPMYSAVLVCAVGWAIAFGGAWHYALCFILLFFFWLKSNVEERWLLSVHPEYAKYRLSAGRFLPKFRIKN
jgi:protein-S-isoprenylcysteine O-methyltransferase Ste14